MIGPLSPVDSEYVMPDETSAIAPRSAGEKIDAFVDAPSPIPKPPSLIPKIWLSSGALTQKGRIVLGFSISEGTRIMFSDDLRRDLASASKGTLIFDKNAVGTVKQGEVFAYWVDDLKNDYPLSVFDLSGIDVTRRLFVAWQPTETDYAAEGLSQNLDARIFLPENVQQITALQNIHFDPVVLISGVAHGDRGSIEVAFEEPPPEKDLIPGALKDFFRSELWEVMLRSTDDGVYASGYHHVGSSGLAHEVHVPLVKAGGKPVGMIKLTYYKNSESDPHYKVSVDHMMIKGPSRYYGVELMTNVLRLHRLDSIFGEVYFEASDKGRYAWRHFDGLELDRDTLGSVRRQLLEWNARFRWGLSKKMIKEARSPLEVSRLIDLGRAFPPLFEEARSAYEGTGRLVRREFEQRSRYPGEIALLLARRHSVFKRSYEARIHPQNDATYVRLLDSVISFWEARKSTVTRSNDVLDDLRRERRAILVPTKPICVLAVGQSETGDRVQKVALDKLVSAESTPSLVWPQGIDPECLERAMTSINGLVHAVNLSCTRHSSDGSFDVRMDLFHQRQGMIGDFRVSYRPDPAASGKWIVSDSYIHIRPEYRRAKYGIELRTQAFRFHYDNPFVTSWEFHATEDGAYIWKNFDGIRLTPSYAQRFLRKLQEINVRHRLGIPEAKLHADGTIYGIVRNVVLQHPNPVLLHDVMRIYDSALSQDERLAMTRRVGEIALLSLTGAGRIPDIGHRPHFEASLDLKAGSKDYVLFLRSVCDYWRLKKTLVPRAPAIMQDLEKEILRVDPKKKTARSERRAVARAIPEGKPFVSSQAIPLSRLRARPPLKNFWNAPKIRLNLH